MATPKMSGYEMPHYTEHDLCLMDKDSLVWAYCLLQHKFERLRDCDYADLEERYHILKIKAFGRSSEKSSILGGQPLVTKTAKTDRATTKKTMTAKPAAKMAGVPAVKKPRVKRRQKGILSGQRDVQAGSRITFRSLRRT